MQGGITDSLPNPGLKNVRDRLNGSDFLKRGTKIDKLNPESNAEQINNNMNYQSAMNA
jgi:hypothetical protein